jgi:glycosyltransferase involved in cell wall biosynthesis
MVGADRVVGGIPSYVNTIIQRADMRHFKFHVIVTPNLVPDPAAPKFEHAKLHEMKFRYGFLSLPQRVLELRKLIVRNSIDVVHAHASRAGILAAFATLGLPVRMVYTGHGWRSKQLPGSLKRYVMQIAERIICTRADSITYLSNSEMVYARTALLDRGRGIVIKTRIDGQCFFNPDLNAIQKMRVRLDIPTNARVIGMIGRLEDQKDPEFFIRVGFEILKCRENVWLVWIGEGPLRSKVEEVAALHKVVNRVRLPGRIEGVQIPAVLSLFDLMLCTSKYEGFPIAILESQAAGIPVVCRAFEGVEDIIDSAKTGEIFGFNDVIEARNMVLKILGDKNISRSLANLARTVFIENFNDLDKMISEFESIYDPKLEQHLEFEDNHAER